jgi:hypothetical protein
MTTTITGTSLEDRYTFLIISRSFLLRMRNVSDKSCTENQNTHFVFGNFFTKIVSVNEKMWENVVVRQTKGDDIIRGMRTACWITEATNTHSEYVIPNVFFF